MGVTLNEIATGRLPEEKICKGRLGVVVRRCTELDPKRRYQTADKALKHIQQMEKKTIGYILGGTCLFGIILYVLVIVLFLQNIRPESTDAVADSRDLQDDDLVNSHTEESTQSPTEAGNSIEANDMFSNTSVGRIIETEEPNRHPFALMREDGDYESLVILEDGQKIQLSAVKAANNLDVTLTMDSGEEVQFEFTDDFYDIYIDRGTYNNIEFSETSPEWEIMLDDIDADGTTDFLVTLAWRTTTPLDSYEYHLTEYSIVWVVYLNDENEFACSDTNIFDGIAPKLDTDELLFDGSTNEWFYFKNGVWQQAY